MSTIRAFIAIPLPNSVKDALIEVSRTLSGRFPAGAVRWVRPEQMHLTLVFLGETAVDKLPAIHKAMDIVAIGHAPFAMSLDEIGCFPNARRPRVIWVGLAGEEVRLAMLKSALDAGLAPLGWLPEDKPFRAHLTLGRVKDDRGVQGVEWSVDVPRLSVPVTALHLIESDLRPNGPIYTMRHSSSLVESQ